MIASSSIATYNRPVPAVYHGTPKPSKSLAGKLMKNLPRIAGFSGIGMGLIGTGLQMDAYLRRADGAAAANEYNARMAELFSQDEARRLRLQARKQISAQFTQRMAKSGLLPESGGWLDVVAQNAGQLEMDAVNVEIAGANTARLDRQRAALVRAEGKQLAGSSLISGLTDAVVGLSRVV